jgi:hypothetical protein
MTLDRAWKWAVLVVAVLILIAVVWSILEIPGAMEPLPIEEIPSE